MHGAWILEVVQHQLVFFLFFFLIFNLQHESLSKSQDPLLYLTSIVDFKI